MGFSCPWFTWERGNLLEKNIKERLDIGIANITWLDIILNMEVHHLAHSFSNHCPLLVTLDKESKQDKSQVFQV